MKNQAAQTRLYPTDLLKSLRMYTTCKALAAASAIYSPTVYITTRLLVLSFAAAENKKPCPKNHKMCCLPDSKIIDTSTKLFCQVLRIITLNPFITFSISCLKYSVENFNMMN